jgi:hypothetical protein
MPNTIVLPTFGNNDFEFHYQVPQLDMISTFYGEIFSDWFETIAANKRLLNQTESIRRTFMQGGFYRANLNSNTTILAINSVAWSIKNFNISLDGGQ